VIAEYATTSACPPRVLADGSIVGTERARANPPRRSHQVGDRGPIPAVMTHSWSGGPERPRLGTIRLAMVAALGLVLAVRGRVRARRSRRRGRADQRARARRRTRARRADHRAERPVVANRADPDGTGYWLLGRTAGSSADGSAAFYGSTGAMHLNAPVVGHQRRRRAARATGSSHPTAASSVFGDAAFHRIDRRAHLKSTGSSAWHRRRAARATGSSHPTAASSASATRPFHGSTGAMVVGASVAGMARDRERPRLLDRGVRTGTSTRSAMPTPLARSRRLRACVGVHSHPAEPGSGWPRAVAPSTRPLRPLPRRRKRVLARAGRGISARRARLLGRDGAVGAPATGQLRKRPAHRVLERPATDLARRGERAGVELVPRVRASRLPAVRHIPRVREDRARARRFR